MLEIRDKVNLSDIERTDILDAIDIAWSTVGTVTPAGQQKLILDYAAYKKSNGKGIGSGRGNVVGLPEW